MKEILKIILFVFVFVAIVSYVCSCEIKKSNNAINNNECKIIQLGKIKGVEYIKETFGANAKTIVHTERAVIPLQYEHMILLNTNSWVEKCDDDFIHSAKFCYENATKCIGFIP